MKPFIIAGVVLAIIISLEFIVIRSQKSKLEGITRELHVTQAALATLEAKTERLAQTFAVFDKAFTQYLSAQEQAHTRHEKAIQTIDTGDGNTADWLMCALPDSVQDALAGNSMRGDTAANGATNTM